MKFLKHLSVLLAVTSVLLMSCEPDENPCPDAIITVDLDSGTQSYTITAEGLEDIIYGWYVDDNLVETEDLDDLRDNIFGFELEPGTYDICIKAESDICNGSIEICAEVTIEANCLELEFETDERDDFAYAFTADFEGIEGTEYTWYIDDDSVQTESIDTNRSHLFEYQFAEEGTYTVCIKAETECGEIEFCEELEVGHDPENCPDLFFESDLNSDGGYTFTAEFGGMDTVTYYWYINEEVVDKENFEGLETDHQLEWAFEPGEYDICIIADVDGCEEIEFCEEIVIESDCVEEVSFVTVSEDGFSYVFEADFEEHPEIPYKWYINEELVDYENFEDGETDHLLSWTFTPGEYDVCLVSYQEDCEEVEYCETIVIEEDCPELSFIASADGEFAYLFEADFEGKEETAYKWTINDEVVDKENYDGVETDHELYWQFSAGEYDVCIIVENDRCESVEYCIEIVIEEEEDSCPDLEFTYELTSAGSYLFTADFPGIDSIEWYGWYVNGELVDEEGTINDGDNILQYDLPEGEYEVCIMTETPECPAGIEYCKTITIGTDSSCAQMSYTAERDETAPAYTFTADFDSRDDVSYEWHVYVNDDYQGGEVRDAGSTDDHSFYWQFESGVVYEICLRAVDEDCLDFQECKEFVID